MEYKPDLCPTSCDVKESILWDLELRPEEIGSIRTVEAD